MNFTVEQFHEFNGQNVYPMEFTPLSGPLEWVIGQAKLRFAIQRGCEPMRNAVRVLDTAGAVVWSSLGNFGDSALNSRAA